ncbi:CDP-glucose 4,6-dehydratase [Sneathiella glossodoripedis]|uniref:CDP-glucose 4,6-dehydratase n=1 Tax=Sneathiella glossodoripedis TaxID=418853 RepID=UPI0004729637|nr:CDP-glucose 4,6-dehydratase [Sneathiella glossodoripedis]
MAGLGLMSANQINKEFWYGKRVLLTGHTGFKGAWAATYLAHLGADVTGISLPPDPPRSLHDMLKQKLPQKSYFADIRNRTAVGDIIHECKPQIILHMAAQALVRRSYRFPLDTYETNVIGTLNILDSVKDLSCLQAVLVVTSDKVYQNNEDGRPFTEDDPLGGDDPYSSSKAACEIATASFAKSFFTGSKIPIATARAGNVIGGGDFSEDRLIPDIWRAAEKGEVVKLRYPNATRPWQHVLESISGYLTYLQALATSDEKQIPRALNFGPDNQEVLTVGNIANSIQRSFGINSDWELEEGPEFAEKSALALDASLARKTLGWRAKWNSQLTLEKTVTWYQALRDKQDMYSYTLSQIQDYLGENK